MDAKHKALLHHHRNFLSHNIVWSDTLAATFKNQNLLTDFMIKQIEECTSRSDKVKKFIEIFPLKGNNFDKLLDILQTSGHVFIADFLREDEVQQHKIFDISAMYKDLPFVKRALKEDEKKQVEVYITEKIEAQVLKILWKRDNKEKDKALESKMKQIEQQYEYEEQSKAKADTIAKLEEEVHAAADDKEELARRLTKLSEYHQEQEKKHRAALALQMKYSEASENAERRAQGRIQTMDSVLQSIKSKLDQVLRIHKEHHLPVPGSEREEDVKELIKQQGDFYFLSEDIDLFIRKFRALLEVKRQYEQLQEERDYILVHLGWNSKAKANGEASDKPSLMEAYKAFALRNEENLQNIKEELHKTEGLLEENKAKVVELNTAQGEKENKFLQGASTWQAAIMNVMRNQNTDLKSEARKKDTLMSMQEQEISKLKKRICELEGSVAHLKRQRLTLEDAVDGGKGAGRSGGVTPEVSGSATPSAQVKVKNLPPLKRDMTSSNSPKLTLNDVTGIPREKRGAPVVVMTRNFQTDQEAGREGKPVATPSHQPKMSTFQMGPIVSGAPGVRNSQRKWEGPFRPFRK